MPPDLIAKLDAVGGAWTGAKSQWDTYEIYTPRCDPEPICWCTLTVLEELIAEWAVHPQCYPRPRVWMGWMCRDHE